MTQHRRKTTVSWFSFLILTLSACSSMQVNTIPAPQTNFAQYKTYAWAPVKASAAPEASILEQTVKSSVESQLAAKGMRQAVEGETADLVISYSALAKNSVEYGMAPGPYGWGDVTTAY